MIVIQDLAKRGDDLKFKMAVMPYSVKPFKRLLLNYRVTLVDILHEACGAPPYIK